jgi:hypothetical protein
VQVGCGAFVTSSCWRRAASCAGLPKARRYPSQPSQAAEVVRCRLGVEPICRRWPRSPDGRGQTPLAAWLCRGTHRAGAGGHLPAGFLDALGISEAGGLQPAAEFLHALVFVGLVIGSKLLFGREARVAEIHSENGLA